MPFVWLVVLFIIVTAESRRLLQALPTYEELHKQSAASLLRRDNLDIGIVNGEGPIAFCHLVDFNWHAVGSGPDLKNFWTFNLQSTATIALALEHLNAGDGSVVAEVKDLNERCPIRFTSEFVDTNANAAVAMDHAISIIQRDGKEEEPLPRPCGFFGAMVSRASQSTALYTSLKGYPQLSALSTSRQLDNKEQYPLFGRVIPSNNARPILQFLATELNVHHVALLHTSLEAAVEFADSFRMEGSLLGVSVETVAFDDTSDDFSTPITAINDTGFRYIFVSAPDNSILPILKEGYKEGLSGTNGYSWILPDSANYLFRGNFELENEFAEASSGIFVFEALSGLSGMGHYDAFLEKFDEFADSPEDWAYLQSKLPKHPQAPMYKPEFDSETFAHDPGTHRMADFYDMAISMGLAACNALLKSQTGGITGPDHYKYIMNSSFVGASGHLTFDSYTGSRNASSRIFVMKNLQREDVQGNITFRAIHTHTYSDGHWKEEHPVVFANGSLRPPQSLPELVVNQNFIGYPLRFMGLTFASYTVFISLAFSAWTFFSRGSYIVRASQPIFLHIICLGTGLMGSSIAPMSFDDELISTGHLNGTCMAFPWLFFLGWCCSFAGLFSKTRRINAIFQNSNSFRRLKISPQDVIRPMFTLVLINVSILLLWTLLHPLHWQRTLLSQDRYGRGKEYVGTCTSNELWAFFGPLLGVNLLALSYAVQQSYAARKLSTEFAESEWIARAMSFILLVAVVTVPVQIIASEDPRSSFFVRAMFIFVVCQSLLGFIFVPKLFATNTQANIKTAIRASMRASSGDVEQRNETAPRSTDSSFLGPEVIDQPKMLEEALNELETLRAALEKIQRNDTRNKHNTADH